MRDTNTNSPNSNPDKHCHCHSNSSQSPDTTMLTNIAQRNSAFLPSGKAGLSHKDYLPFASSVLYLRHRKNNVSETSTLLLCYYCCAITVMPSCHSWYPFLARVEEITARAMMDRYEVGFVCYCCRQLR